MRSVTIVVPVFRAEMSLNALYEQIASTMPAIATEFEVILVDDGSDDASWTIIQALVARDARFRGFRLNRNFGQHNALLCGIRAARYEIIVTMDDDLQHPVAEIATLLAALDDDVDVIYGAPRQKQHGLFRNIASEMTKLALAGAMGAETGRNVSAFRAFRTRLRDSFSDYRSPSVSIDVLLTWATKRFSMVRVLHLPRQTGESGYSIGKLMAHAVNLMTGFSTLPLQVASVMGFLCVLFGILIMGYILVNFMMRGAVVPGFTFLASIITIFSGVQLFALGIIGEYIARIHFRSMERPPYVIRETASPEAEQVEQMSRTLQATRID